MVPLWGAVASQSSARSEETCEPRALPERTQKQIAELEENLQQGQKQIQDVEGKLQEEQKRSSELQAQLVSGQNTVNELEQQLMQKQKQFQEAELQLVRCQCLVHVSADDGFCLPIVPSFVITGQEAHTMHWVLCLLVCHPAFR